MSAKRQISIIGRRSLPRAYPLSKHSARFASSDPTNQYERVETPVQAQKPDAAAPQLLKPAADAPRAQTPVQSVRPEQILSHPIGQQQRKRPSNTGPLATFFVGICLIPVTVYYWYNHRKEHMETKWDGMLKEAQLRRARD